MAADIHPFDPIKEVAAQYNVNLDADDWYDQLAEALGIEDDPLYNPEHYPDIPDWHGEAPLRWFFGPRSFNADDLTHRYGDGVSSQLSKYRDSRILDMGCGATSGVPAIAGDDNTVVQVDKNPQSLTYGDMFKQRHDETTIRSSHVQADGEELPFADDTFDVIFAGAVIGHGDDSVLPDQDHDLYRVLQPGGDFLLASNYVERADNALPQYNATKPLNDGTFEAAYKKDSLLVLENYSP